MYRNNTVQHRIDAGFNTVFNEQGLDLDFVIESNNNPDAFRINAGEDFAERAKAHSTCPSKAQGGDLGQFGPGMMVKEFDEVVFSADVNSLQGPVKTQFGYHLLEVTNRED